MSAALLRVLHRSLTQEPTFPEVGWTRAVAFEAAPLPGGYHHLRYARRVGQGAAGFAAAGAAVMSWQMHRGAGIRVAATHPVAVTGATMVSALGVGPFHLSGPCRIVWTIDEARCRGFGYATLPGHPEQGEECFAVDHRPDDSVWLTVTAFSRAGRWYTRAASPVVVALQWGAAAAYGWSVARAVRRAVTRAVTRAVRP